MHTSHQKPVLSRIDGQPASLPLVSAIIPTYNGATLITRAIESALSQTHHLLEIIVVVDGSTDNTVNLARSYPVIVIEQKNGGPASARNTGARAAEGEWLAFLDHDDVWYPDKTTSQLRHVKPWISAVFCEKAPNTGSVTFTDMFAFNYGGNPSSTIIRADVLAKLGMFDEDPAIIGVDDYNLWLRFLLEGYKFASTPTYYDFTPADGHYGNKSDLMLAAELANIEKIAVLAELDEITVEIKKRRLRLSYLPRLIEMRKLEFAREQLKEVGFDRESARYWAAYLPGWCLDLRRTMLLWMKRLKDN